MITELKTNAEKKAEAIKTSLKKDSTNAKKVIESYQKELQKFIKLLPTLEEGQKLIKDNVQTQIKELEGLVCKLLEQGKNFTQKSPIIKKAKKDIRVAVKAAEPTVKATVAKATAAKESFTKAAVEKATAAKASFDKSTKAAPVSAAKKKPNPASNPKN